jgi:hypothetical protein
MLLVTFPFAGDINISLCHFTPDGITGVNSNVEDFLARKI